MECFGVDQSFAHLENYVLGCAVVDCNSLIVAWRMAINVILETPAKVRINAGNAFYFSFLCQKW